MPDQGPAPRRAPFSSPFPAGQRVEHPQAHTANIRSLQWRAATLPRFLSPLPLVGSFLSLHKAGHGAQQLGVLPLHVLRGCPGECCSSEQEAVSETQEDGLCQPLSEIVMASLGNSKQAVDAAFPLCFGCWGAQSQT